MVVTLGQQYNVGEKPTVILYTYINHHAQLPVITQLLGIKKCSFQKESVVCGRRIGIRKGSGDIVYDPRPEDPIVQFKLP